MNFNCFLKRIDNVSWFENVGNYIANSQEYSIPDLKAWDNTIFKKDLDSELRFIATHMQWLPSTRDQDSPIDEKVLDKEFKKIKDGKKMVMVAYKTALASLRNKQNSLLISGAHDYFEAAKGAALYCVRKTAKECLTNKPGFWTDVFLFYCKGFWPCGLIQNQRLVVY